MRRFARVLVALGFGLGAYALCSPVALANM